FFASFGIGLILVLINRATPRFSNGVIAMFLGGIVMWCILSSLSNLFSVIISAWAAVGTLQNVLISAGIGVVVACGVVFGFFITRWVRDKHVLSAHNSTRIMGH